MKSFINTLLIALILCIATPGFAQLNRKIANTSRLSALVKSTKLKWYTTALDNSLLQRSNTGASVLHSRTVGGNRVEIGVGLTGSEEGFSPVGSPRQEESAGTVCTIQPTKIDFLGDNNFNLFTTSTNLEPGQFFNINSIITNSFTAFASPARKPYQIGMNIFNPANPAPNMLEVTNLTRAALPEIQSTLLAPNYGASIPAEGILNIVRIGSTYEASAQFKTSQGIFLPLAEFGIPIDLNAGVRADGAANAAARLNFYMVHFYQPMYTLNLLTNNDALFQQANAHLSCANGAYVQSVTYGRRVVMIIGSIETEQRVTAAISAALSASVTGGEFAGVEVGSSVSGETAVSLRNIAQKFSAKIYGGEGSFGNALFSDIVNFRDAFRAYINSPSASVFRNSTGAVPLHYTLRRISDNSLLAVRSVGNFDELVSCNTSKYYVEVLWKGFRVDQVVEAPLDTKEDIYGTLKLASVSINGNTQNKNIIIKAIPVGKPISKGLGETDNDDVSVRVLTGLDKTSLLNCILTFDQAFYDFDLLTKPRYQENSSSQLVFNFSGFAANIKSIQPGQSRIFDKEIRLTESGPIGESKIALLVKVRVVRE